MDYSQLSDFEINKRVAQLHGGFALTLAVHDEPPSGKSFDPGRFDPCHNPADAWPIISANRISVEYDSEHQCDVPAEWVTAYGIDDLKVHVVAHQPCDKALRSAMIVFLMMQDANHA